MSQKDSPQPNDIEASRSMRGSTDAEQCFRWAYQLLIALAKRCKDDEDSMHKGQDWSGLVGTSHSMYLHRARAEAGIDGEQFLNVVRTKIDVSDIYDQHIQ